MLIGFLFYLRKFMKTQWLPESDLKKEKERYFESLLKHAVSSVDFYKKNYKKLGINIQEVNLANIDKLPFITKTQIKKNYSHFFSANFPLPSTKRFFESSGTTGETMTTFFDDRAYDIVNALYFRSLMAAKYNPRKELVMLYHKKYLQKNHTALGLMRKKIIPVHLNFQQQVLLLKKYNPEYLHYFSSVLWGLTKKMKAEGLEMNVKSTITTGDILTGHMRKLIENVLNTEVFDHYASAEFGRIAFECEYHNYHLTNDALIVETMRNGETVFGEKGNIVITSLFNYLMPFIRYDIGDIGQIEKDGCECGRKLPLLKKIYGRSKKLIILNSGKIFTERDLLDSLSQINCLCNFQIKYKGKNNFFVKYETFEDNEECESSIFQSMEKIFKEKIFVKFKQSSNISKSPGGKINFIEVRK